MQHDIFYLKKSTVRIIEREIGGAVAEWVERDRVVPVSRFARVSGLRV